DLEGPNHCLFAAWRVSHTFPRVFLPENLGACALQKQTSCLGAGGTLATRLNSNYACMGLPPDDMIGILRPD
ncbi:hypothetical protein XENOCAPTIV_015391, partial [Xenoophorus captivus]